MDHHTSWFSFFPGYSGLKQVLQNDYANTVMLGDPAHIEVRHIYAGLLVFALLLVMSLAARVRLRNIEDHIVPSTKFGLVTFLEIFTEAVLGIMKDVIGKDYKKHVALVGSLALFIFFSNMLGLIPGFVPPTDNLNTTFACALVVFIWFNAYGIQAHGMGHITHLLNPWAPRQAGSSVGFLAPLKFSDCWCGPSLWRFVWHAT